MVCLGPLPRFQNPRSSPVLGFMVIEFSFKTIDTSKQWIPVNNNIIRISAAETKR